MLKQQTFLTKKCEFVFFFLNLWRLEYQHDQSPLNNYIQVDDQMLLTV